MAGSSSRWRIRPWPSRPTSTATRRWRSMRTITFIRPGRVGETLVAEAVERMRAGRSGMYDVRVSTAGGDLVAEFRGHTRTLRGTSRRRRKPMAGLDPIETASRDEIAALQRERIAWTLRHAYDNVPHYRARVRRGRRASGRLPPARRPREIPVHHQAGSARQLSVRHVRRAARADRAHPRLVRHDRQADRGRLHARGSRRSGRRWWRARSAPPAGGRG